MAYLALVVILGFLGAMAFFLMQKKKVETNSIMELAKTEGWNYIEQIGGIDGIYSLEGSLPNEASWKLTAYAPSSERHNAMLNVSSEYTEWKASFPLKDFQCYIMPKDPSMKMIPQDKMFQSLKVAWKKMGLAADAWILFEPEDTELHNSYLIVTNQILTFKNMLNQKLISQLKSFALLPYIRRPSFQFDKNQMGVQFRKVIDKPREIKELVTLGLAFYHALKP